CSMTFLNSALPCSVFRLIVRLCLLAFSTRKNRLSLSLMSRMLVRATSPPLGSSSLMTSAPRKPRICAQAGPAWLWVMSMTRMPDSALMLNLPNDRESIQGGGYWVDQGSGGEDQPCRTFIRGFFLLMT